LRVVTMIMDVDLLLGVGGMVGLLLGIVGLYLLPLPILLSYRYRT
jgi:hypothetical protein